jgi:Fe-S cluster assembly scaffold IscU
MRRVFGNVVTPALFTVALRGKKYSDKVLDHYNNPRNVGSMDKDDPNVGTGTRGAAECGDIMQIQLKVNPETLVVEETKFKAFGCGSAIASSSFASEVLRGKTLAQALELTNKDIAAELNLPPVKLHCSMLAEESIRAAVENYLSKKPESVKTKVYRKKTPPTEEPAKVEAAASQ